MLEDCNSVMLFFGEKVKATTDPDKKAMQVKSASAINDYQHFSIPASLAFKLAYLIPKNLLQFSAEAVANNCSSPGETVRNDEDLCGRVGGGGEGGEGGAGGGGQATTFVGRYFLQDWLPLVLI